MLQFESEVQHAGVDKRQVSGSDPTTCLEPTGAIMSNEMLDWFEDVKQYEEAVFKDFQEQFPEDKTDKDFIDYLLSRMRSEGLPEKEPTPC